MTALLLARSFPPIVGGIERYISELFRRLPDGVVAVAPDGEGASRFDASFPHPVRRYWLPRLANRGKLPLLSLAARAFPEALRSRPRVVISEQVQTAAIGVPLARALGVPHVVFAYGMEMSPLRMRSMKQWAFRSSARVLAISHFARDIVEQLYQVDRDLIGLVPPGIEPGRFGNRAGAPRWPQRPAGPVLLTLGRLDPTQRYKGYDRVLRLCAALRDEYPLMRCLVVGGGPDRGWLEQIAKQLGIVERVEFRGYVSDERLPELFAEADLFVLASGDPDPMSLRVEGFGIVLAEAAAAGLPSVAYRGGGVGDVVLDSVTGVLTEPSESALVRATRELLRDHYRRCEMGRAASRHAQTRLTWTRSVAALHDILRDLAKSSFPAHAS